MLHRFHEIVTHKGHAIKSEGFTLKHCRNSTSKPDLILIAHSKFGSSADRISHAMEDQREVTAVDQRKGVLGRLLNCVHQKKAQDRSVSNAL